MTKAFIIGSGVALPDRVVSNEELAPQLGTVAQQIQKSTGIRNRRWVEPGTPTSTLAAAALHEAISDAGVSTETIDYLIFGTMTPDRFVPGSASAIQRKSGLGAIPCVDIRATCCNTLYGLQLASALLKSEMAKCVAVVVADVQSGSLDLSAASAAVSMLFGDGAAALIVSQQSTNTCLEILDVLLQTNGEHIDDLGVRAPGTEFGPASEDDARVTMNGQSVILNASRSMPAACRKLMAKHDLSAEDIRWLVPHQANGNLMSRLVISLGLPSNSLVSVIEEFGNTSSAAMAIALHTLRHSNQIQLNDYLLMPAFGAGFTWGAGLCRAIKS